MDAAAQKCPRMATVAACLDYRLDGFSDHQALAQLEATTGAGRGELLGNLHRRGRGSARGLSQ